MFANALSHGIQYGINRHFRIVPQIELVPFMITVDNVDDGKHIFFAMISRERHLRHLLLNGFSCAAQHLFLQSFNVRLEQRQTLVRKQAINRLDLDFGDCQ